MNQKFLEPTATKNQKIKYYSRQIQENSVALAKMEDYVKVIQSIVPLVELARKYALKVDLDNGEAKKSWEIILADVLTIKEEVAERYSGISDTSQEMQEELKKLKEE